MLCPLCGSQLVPAGQRDVAAEDSGGGSVLYDVWVCSSGKDRCAEHTEVLKPAVRRDPA